MDKVYVTKSGDTWDRIAKEMYGSEIHTSFLMSNNQQHLKYFVFPEGVELEIVELPKDPGVELPGWRE